MNQNGIGFEYRNEELFCEDVSVRALCERYGTPLYVYSRAAFVHQFTELDTAFAGMDHVICFAMKSNANLAVLRALAQQGAGVDIVSGGELFRALKSGVDPQKIVFAGVGKTAQEITDALNADILAFDVESLPEARHINDIAGRMSKKAPISLRVNPDVDAHTHHHITTGKKGNKFGIDIETALRDFKEAASLEHIDMCGVHAHIGSQITTLEPFELALERLVELVVTLRENGIPIRKLNFGGGLGIVYNDETPALAGDYATRLKPLLRQLGCQIILEPGRFISGNSGILCARVLYRKETVTKTFLIVDGGMNDLVRPAMYDSYHRIRPVLETTDESEVVDVVGPICESSDYFAKEREIPLAQEGDYLAIFSAGAYGFAMSSNYNARPRAAEVLVIGDKDYLIRARETYDDLIRGESIPDVLW